MSDVDMGRVSVQLPVQTLQQIDAWAAAAGVKRGQFTSMALAIGARVLARQVVPEMFMQPEHWKALAEGMGISVEELQRKAAATGKLDVRL